LLRTRAAAFDDRGHERGETRFFPAALWRQFGMDEVEAMERVVLVFDAAVHVYATALAGVALDGGRVIDGAELLFVSGDADLVARHHADDRERGALGLPAFGAAAGVVVRNLRIDFHFHLVVG